MLESIASVRNFSTYFSTFDSKWVLTSDVNRFFVFVFKKKTCFFYKKNIAKKTLFFFENELVFENKFESDSKLNMSIGRHDVYC